MSSARPPHRRQPALSLLLGLQLALLCQLLLPLGALAQDAPPAGPDRGNAAAGEEPAADEDQRPYQRHLDNGVKLYRLKDYTGALAEFKAAYRAEQKASPLINQALCYRALRDYPRAIAALEQAVEKHSDTMTERNREAATREIKEMRALLAYVTVQLKPAEAMLFVNGTAQPLGQHGVIELSPGEHKLEARAEGYQSKTVALTVASGKRDEPVKIELEPSSGQVSIIAASDEAWIEVDDKQTKQGIWQGRLSPGVHVVQIKREGEEPRSVSILVAAGGKYRVTQKEPGGELETDAKVVEDGGKPDAGEEPDVRRGVYALFGAGFLTAATHPVDFEPSEKQLQGGVAVEVHGGYRVTEWAAFEGLFQFCDLRVEGNIAGLPTEYKLKSFRFGLMLRFMYPPRTMFRFVGGVGGGMMYEIFEWDHGDLEADITSLEGGGRYLDTEGFGGFAQLEAGLELEISNILFDLVFQNIVQSTKGLDTSEEKNPFETAPWWILGPSIRVGYSLW